MRSYDEATAAWEARREFFEQPLLAPLRADLSGFPPLLLLSATRDYFYSDGPALGTRACEAGTRAVAFNVAGAFHDFIEYSEGCGGGAPTTEALEAYARIAQFVRRSTAPPRPAPRRM